MINVQRLRQKSRINHADDWLITYADMITLLLCFFAIFLSVSMPKKEKVEQVKNQVQVQFGVPDLTAGQFPPREIPQTVKSEEKSLDALPSIVDRFAEEAQKNAAEKSDKITSLEINSAAFFARGSATLSEEGKNILLNVLANLTADQFKDYQVTVEGHTDDAPVSTAQFPSNWELSTARAAAVVRFFLEQGIDARRLRAAGYADTFPKAPNRDAAGNAIPENQALNRRVVIQLQKIEKAE